MDIGSKIKTLRIKNNLTLEDLASRSELSKGFLSQIERNLSSPSIATLEDIVEVLGISLQDFFKDEVNEKYVYTSKDFFVDDKGGHKITYLVPSSKKMEAIELTLGIDESSQDIKTHEGEEFAYVIKGKVKLIDLSNDIEYILTKGDTFYLNGEFKHRIKNISKQESKVIWISSPSIF